MIAIRFSDPELQKHCEKVISIMTSLPEDLRPICALLDAWHWFRLAEGEQSAKASEAIRHLADPQMRSALKLWYLRTSKSNIAANEARLLLERTVGERLPCKDI